MAVIDDYLIISNSTDYNKMIVMDRYNGKVLDVKVNTTGIDAGRSIHAITSDDAGHLVAMAYTSTLDANVTDPNVRAWVCLTASRMHLRASFMQILMGVHSPMLL